MNDPHDFPVEFKIILASLRLPTDPSSRDVLKDLIGRGPDWKEFVDLAFRHKVVPQVYGSLDAEAKALLPDDTRQKLKDMYLRNSKKAMIRSAEAVGLLKRFEEQGITALALKGPPLSLWAYGDVSLRYAGDLDLFVAPEHAEPAGRIIEEAGYKNITDGLHHKDRLMRLMSNAEYHSKARDLLLELHWRLTHHKLMPVDFKTLHARSQTTTIAGYPIPVLAPEDRFLYLVVHGSNHGWFRLAWLCDIAQILRRHPDLNWTDIVTRANDMGLDREMRQSCIWCGHYSARLSPNRSVCRTDRPPSMQASSIPP